jgi:hypothetical protein
MQKQLQKIARDSGIAQFMGWVAAVIKFAERSAGPMADLAIRLWLAQIFFVSGVIKLSNWDNALLLSQTASSSSARCCWPLAWRRGLRRWRC